MMQRGLYDKLVPSLKPDAQEAYEQIVSLGVDSDLALLTLEKLAYPESIYEVPEEEEDERK